MPLIHWICWSKSSLRSQSINLHRIRLLKAHQREQNCLQTDSTMNITKPSNSETSKRIRSRKKLEFRSHERNHLFDQWFTILKIFYYFSQIITALSQDNHKIIDHYNRHNWFMIKSILVWCRMIKTDDRIERYHPNACWWTSTVGSIPGHAHSRPSPVPSPLALCVCWRKGLRSGPR